MFENVSFRKIRANCPCCMAACTDIVYQNSGPIVRIYCTKCGLIYKESDAWDHGFENIIDYWNHLGIYMPQDG